MHRDLSGKVPWCRAEASEILPRTPEGLGLKAFPASMAAVSPEVRTAEVLKDCDAV